MKNWLIKKLGGVTVNECIELQREQRTAGFNDGIREGILRVKESTEQQQREQAIKEKDLQLQKLAIEIGEKIFNTLFGGDKDNGKKRRPNKKRGC